MAEVSPHVVEAALDIWPVVAGLTAAFFTGMVTSVSITLWLSNRLNKQDKERAEMKEQLVEVIRATRHSLYGRIDQQYVIDEKMDSMQAEIRELGERVTRLEATVENGYHRQIQGGIR